MIAWNSQMALDARQQLFFNDSSPERAWKVTNSEGKSFVLKLYTINEATDAVKEGYYMESKFLDDSEKELSFDGSGPEEGTEWAFLETTVDKFLAHYESATEITDELS